MIYLNIQKIVADSSSQFVEIKEQIRAFKLKLEVRMNMQRIIDNMNKLKGMEIQ